MPRRNALRYYPIADTAYSILDTRDGWCELYRGTELLGTAANRTAAVLLLVGLREVHSGREIITEQRA